MAPGTSVLGGEIEVPDGSVLARASGEPDGAWEAIAAALAMG